MTTNHKPLTLAVLKAIAINGTSVLKEIELLFPGIIDMRRVIANLQTHKLVQSELGEKTTMYSATGKGWRLLKALEPKPMGKLPAPRQRLNFDTYTGEKPIAVRPGSEAGFKLPSLENGKRVERKRPIITSG